MQYEKKLGEGGYGIVYAATSPGKSDVVVKRNLLSDDTSFAGSIRELDILAFIQEINKYVVHLKDVYFGQPFFNRQFSPLPSSNKETILRDDNIHFVFERASGDLHDVIYKEDDPFSGRSSASEIENAGSFLRNMKNYMIQLLLGLISMHGNKIIHRDIKPNNILVFTDKTKGSSTVKYCDFGLSKFYTGQVDFNTPKMVTSLYRAPEIIMEINYDYKIDIWALGCVFYEMAAKKPFITTANATPEMLLREIMKKLSRELSVKEVRELIMQRNKIKFTNSDTKVIARKTYIGQMGFTAEGKEIFSKYVGPLDKFGDLLNNMICFDENKRFTALQCLQHSFFDDERELINKMLSKIVVESTQDTIYFYSCKERNWMYTLTMTLFKNRAIYDWYSHRILFHAISFYDLHLYKKSLKSGQCVNSNDMGSFYNRDQHHLYFMTVLYMFIKYFSSTHFISSFDDIASAEYTTTENKLKAAEFEERVIKARQYKIYHDTLYEIADEFNIKLSDDNIEFLLHKYFTESEIFGKNQHEAFTFLMTKYPTLTLSTGTTGGTGNTADKPGGINITTAIEQVTITNESEDF